MIKNKILAGLALGLGMVAVHQASAFELDFGVVGNSQLQFTSKVGAAAAKFQFNASTATGAGKTFDFQVNNTGGGNGGTGSAIGDFGKLVGSFNIAPVTTGPAGNTHYYITTTGGTGPGNITDGSGSPGNPVVHSSRIAYQDFTETGAVSGMGTFTIADGHGHNLTGTATLSNITDQYRVTHNNNSTSTVKSTTFISDGITGTGPVTQAGYSLNLTGITYTGTQADLISLANGDRPENVGVGDGRAELDFTYSFNNKKLTTMTQVGGGVNKVSYSGHLKSDAHSLPDGGMTLVMLGVSLSGAALFKRRLVA